MNYADTLKEVPSIDVSAHRDAQGELYLPSQPWGIQLAYTDLPSSRANVSTSVRTKGDAIAEAKRSSEKRAGTVAVAFNRRNGTIAARFVS